MNPSDVFIKKEYDSDANSRAERKNKAVSRIIQNGHA